MQTSPGQGVNRGAGRYVRGDLKERPTASAVALAVGGVGGALGGGVMLGGFEGVLLGSALLWFVASFGDVIAQRLELSGARKQSRVQFAAQRDWQRRATKAENMLQSLLSEEPVAARRLRRVLRAAQRAGIEARAEHLFRRGEALLELLERPAPQGCVGLVADGSCLAY